MYADVWNMGTRRSPSSTLRFYRSTDTTITTSDTEVGTATFDSRREWTGQRLGISLTTPSSPGDYHYGACVEAVADESNTTNNCSRSVTIWVFARWDVEVGSLTVSDSTPEPGAALTFSVTVSNNGPAAAPGLTLRYYRTTITTTTVRNGPVYNEAVRSFAAGASSTHSSELTAPTSPGMYYYRACVREDPQFTETSYEPNYDNNCSLPVAVTVTEP